MTRRGDRGSIAVHAITVATLLAVAALVMAQMAGLVRMRHRVASAADLAALAGTQASVVGHDGCAAARRIAVHNGAELVACRMDFDVATVTARGTSTSWWGHRWQAREQARAAPDFYLGGD